MTARRAAVAPARSDDRPAAVAERLLRLLGDARLGLGLLLLAAGVNLVAALVPDGPAALRAWPYVALLGAIALTGVAATAVRAPATWREWRRPGPVQAGAGAISARLSAQPTPDAVASRLRDAGYRVSTDHRRGQWAVHGVRRGWSRFAGQGTHLAVVVVVLGAAIGSAFGSETTFSLHAGDQALLDAPRSGFSSAIRLEALDADFGDDGRPRRLDVAASFMRAGEVVEDQVLRVNEPGDFDGYLVHPWTYGPSARLRVTTLDGSPLLDAPVPLADERNGVPVGSVDLPTVGGSLGLALADGQANELGVSLLAGDGLVGTARLTPGDEERLGDVLVRLDGFDAWVTFLSRRDPGLGVLFGGTALLVAGLAVAFWLPRRRVTVRPAGTGVAITLRGERFDRPADDLERLRGVLERMP